MTKQTDLSPAPRKAGRESRIISAEDRLYARIENLSERKKRLLLFLPTTRPTAKSEKVIARLGHDTQQNCKPVDKGV